MTETDGWVTIGTKLDTKQLEKDLNNAKRKLEQYEKEAERLTQQKIKINAEIEINENEYRQKIEKLNQKQSNEYKVNTKFGIIQDKSIIDAKYDQLRYQLDIAYGKSLDKNKFRLEQINKAIEKNAYKQKLVNNEVSELNTKLGKTRGFDKLKNAIDNVGNSVQKVSKKIVAWGLAIFGIRTAINWVKSAINTIAGDDEQLKADIDYMKNALAYTLEPIVRAIVDLAKQLMFYIGYIVKAWTGKNIFENANKGLEKATSNVKGLNKELSKTIADFDEMQVLQDTSTSSGSSGVITPSFDLTNLDDIEAPGWLKFIVNHKKEILSVLSGIAAGLLAIKLGVKGLKALGIGLLISGIVYAIQNLLDYLKDPTWESFGGIIEGIGIAILGIAAIVGSVTFGIIGAVVLVAGIIIKYWDKIKNFLQKGIDWLSDQSAWIHEQFGDFIGDIYDTIVRILQHFLNAFDFIITGIREIFDGVISFITGIFTGDWEKALDGIFQVFQGFLDIIKGAIEFTWGWIMEFLSTIANWIYEWVIKPILDFFGGLWEGIKTGFDEAIQFITGLFQGLWEFVKGIVEKIGEILQPVTDVIGGIIDVGKDIITAPAQLGSYLGKKLSNLFGFKKGGIVVPKLASGGIINQPGRGVPLANAIGGEHGMEGVLPLTDTQQMELLGESIGKYININATIPVYVANRQIAKEIRKINADNDFAFNR